ncbi:methylmalonyl Co-A mutase-associated GTPase MeaB [Leptospira langatensis]|uniref:Methylmalonyl Co-A mutase-associated GTPase MeaB n=1 Tax=Leptospira langatensis TaxID=2484983 RepID=A0A5F1ZQL9_9LEPT|nr:methylmalonyl Co-A mutase-associated GTPase MeaB [Leptospira langatensis]TGK01887.1 methylmalonyl Co-A mutase-associated GTPase MeaB [Leptospira langatensis]TGL39492.1 methylmalonyl Co-A mutase-associated GTPase MeaB [Leptospira langatensis]
MPATEGSDDHLVRGSVKKKTLPDQDTFVKGILAGDIVLLSRAITLIESTLPAHQELAEAILEKCLPHSGKSIRVGITGIPGVGKSSFIETFGNHLIDQGRKIAVLTVDPSSQLSKGSILGDKTRMETLSRKKEAFIRPSPSGESLGGVARKTRETIFLCEAAGFDTVLVETVGVGQSETAVYSMVDLFLLLLIAGAGDELQGIKRGIMEMADLIAVTKADGENIMRANRAKSETISAVHFLPSHESGMKTEVRTCSALTGEGIPEIWTEIQTFIQAIRETGYLDKKRKEQARHWLHESVQSMLLDDFHSKLGQEFAKEEERVVQGLSGSYQAARKLVASYKKTGGPS